MSQELPINIILVTAVDLNHLTRVAFMGLVPWCVCAIIMRVGPQKNRHTVSAISTPDQGHDDTLVSWVYHVSMVPHGVLSFIKID